MVSRTQRCCAAFGAALTFLGTSARAGMPVCDDTYGKVAVSFTLSSGMHMSFGPEGSCEERIKSELRYRVLGGGATTVSCLSADRREGGEKVAAEIYERIFKCLGVPVGQGTQVTCDGNGKKPFSFFY